MRGTRSGRSAPTMRDRHPDRVVARNIIGVTCRLNALSSGQVCCATLAPAEQTDGLGAFATTMKTHAA